MRVAINALHAKSGGGVSYLNGILPHLAEQPDMEWHLFCHQKYRDRLKVPPNVTVHTQTYRDSFLLTLLWEQTVLPVKLWRLGATSTVHMANYVCLLAPRPVALLTNNPQVRHYVRGWGQWAYWRLLMAASWLALWRCPKVLANGRYIGELFTAGWALRWRSKIVHAPAGCSFTPVQGEKRDGNRVLAIGDVYAHKDYATLILALAQVKRQRPQVELHILGRALDKQEHKKVTALIKKCGLEASVRWLGVVPPQQVAVHLAQSAVYVSASKAETFSLTVLESLYSGTPVVVRDMPFQREVGGESVLYVPQFASPQKVAESFAAAILDVMENPQAATARVQAGQAFIRQFSWQNTAQAVLRAVGDAAKGARS